MVEIIPPPQYIRYAPPEPGPGPVGEHPDYGLDKHAGYRCGQPEITQVAHICPERLKNTRSIGVLQRVSYLDTEESETQIPYLPK